jgi:hypothetical protein
LLGSSVFLVWNIRAVHSLSADILLHHVLSKEAEELGNTNNNKEGSGISL